MTAREALRPLREALRPALRERRLVCGLGAATALYDGLGLQRARIRLVGVRVEGLLPRARVHRQLVLGEREHGWAEADRAVDRATRRFGSAAVRPASLID